MSLTDPVDIAGGVVQDFWAIDALTTIDESATTVDLTVAVLAAVRDDLGEPIDLWDGITFREASSLDASLADETGKVRDDVDVVAGIADTSAGEVLIVVATPRSAADLVASTDRLRLDLTFLEGEVAVGDPLFSDYVFMQSFAPEDDAAESTDGGVARFATRVAAGRFSVLAAPNESGELTPVVAGGQLGEFEEGSLLGSIPPKILLYGGIGLAAGVAICLLIKGPACAAIPIFGGGGAFAGASDTLNGNGADAAPPPSDPGGSGGGRTTGEPHLTTFDGIRYDSQLVGEFVLARTDDFEIQTRQSPYGTGGVVAFNTAIAVGIADHRITYDVDADQPLRIDGEVFTLEPGGSVDHGGTLVNAYDSVIEVVTGEGDVIQVWIGPGLDIVTTPADGERAWEGLLGNPNSDPSDDLVTRDGAILEEGNDSGYTLAESWRITDEESLFDYAEGESTATYTDLSYPAKRTALADLSAAVRARAAAICRAAGAAGSLLDECIYDYGITGEVPWAAAAQRLSFALGVGGNTEVVAIPAISLPGYRVDRGSRSVLDGSGRVIFPAREPDVDGAVLVALDPEVRRVANTWPNITYVCGPGVDASGRIWAQRPFAGGPQSMVVIDGASDEEIAVYKPTARGEQIDSCQKSIVGIGDDVVLLHEANFEVTVESFGVDGDAIVSRWRRGFPDATLADLDVGPDGEVYVLTRNPAGDTAQIILSRIDPDSGEIMAEVTLAGERFEEGSASVVVDEEGRVFVVTTQEADTRAGYVFGVSPRNDTLTIDWQIDVDGTSTEGIRQVPRSLNIVGDNILGWYKVLSEVVAIDRGTGEFAWAFEPEGASRGIDEIPGDSAGNAYLTRAESYLVVVDGNGVEVRSLTTDAAGVPPIVTFGPMGGGKLYTLSLGENDVPIWAAIDVAP